MYEFACECVCVCVGVGPCGPCVSILQYHLSLSLGNENGMMETVKQDHISTILLLQALLPSSAQVGLFFFVCLFFHYFLTSIILLLVPTFNLRITHYCLVLIESLSSQEH